VGLLVAFLSLVPIPAARGAPDAVGISKSVDDSSPDPGQLIVYTIVVENTGVADETGGVISDTLDSDLVFAGPVTLEGSTGTVALDAGDLPILASGLTVGVGERVTVTLPVTVSASASPGTVIDNTAAFTSTQTTSPETAFVQVTVASPNCYARVNATVYSSSGSDAVQEAIDAAIPGDTVQVAGTCVGVQSAGGGDQVAYISKNLTLRGGFSSGDWSTYDPSGNPTTLDADSLGRVIVVDGSVTVGIEGLILQNGDAPGASDVGGGLYVGAGTVTLTDIDIQLNMANQGGGVYVDTGSVTLSGGEISWNDADNRGGGVYVNASSAVFNQTGGTVSHNDAVDRGGGVFIYAGTGTLSNGAISYNVALHGGGVSVHESGASFTQSGGVMEHNSISGVSASGAGIYVFEGHFEMTAGDIRYNDSQYYGGGVDVSRGTAVLSGGRIYSNTATYGGGVVADFSTVTLSGVEISYNQSTYGGGVHTYEGRVTLSGGQIVHNTATNGGGGVYINRAASVFTQTAGVIAYNTASHGGGIYLYLGDGVLNGGRVSENNAGSGGGVSVAEPSAYLCQNSGSVISGNTATANGGGISVSDGGATVRGEISDNSARFGGGMYVLTGTVALEGATIITNSATNYGGGLVIDTSSVTMDGGEISGNTSGLRGGGIYVMDSGSTLELVGGATVSSNSTLGDGGGIYMAGGATSLQSATIEDNGVGLYVGGPSSGSLTARNSTIQNNATAGLVYSTTSTLFGVTLGGTPGTANTFEGNGKNITVYAANTSLPVTAYWNDWGSGVSGIAAVEAMIDHQFDDAGLARVDYYGIAVDVDPTVQAADGVSQVVVAATLESLPNMAAGDVIEFTSDLGSLSAPSASTDGTGEATVMWTSSVASTGHVTASAQIDPIPAVTGMGTVAFSAIEISKSVLPVSDVPYHGTVTYTVVVDNIGVADDNSMFFTDTLPAELDFGAWLEQPSGASVSCNEITWNGGLSAGTAVTFSFTANHIGSTSGTVVNTAFFSGTLQGGSDSASCTVEHPAPDLSIVKSVEPTSDVAYGGTVTYTIVIDNAGTGADSSVLVTDTLPAQVHFGTWLDQPAGATMSADEITWSGEVAAGAAITLSFTADHIGSFGDVVVNTARFSGTGRTGIDNAIFSVEGGYSLYLPLIERLGP